MHIYTSIYSDRCAQKIITNRGINMISLSTIKVRVSDNFPEISKYFGKDYFYENEESNNQALQLVSHSIDNKYPDAVIKDLFNSALISPFSIGVWDRIEDVNNSTLDIAIQKIQSMKKFEEIRKVVLDESENIPDNKRALFLRSLSKATLKRVAELASYEGYENAPISCVFSNDAINMDNIMDTFYAAMNQTELYEVILHLTNVIYM
jgi:predicted RNA-binding protein with PIN domain